MKMKTIHWGLHDVQTKKSPQNGSTAISLVALVSQRNFLTFYWEANELVIIQFSRFIYEWLVQS